MSSHGHHSRGGQAPHNNMASDQEGSQRVRYMAHMERRARPPTFRPLTIVAVVLFTGLFVIGLIMLLIAHWPGVSGGDSLKIAGGVLLAIGASGLIITLIITCVLHGREKKRFETNIAEIAASRSHASVISRHTTQSNPVTPSFDTRPGKSILKKTPSTSTYGTNRGSVFDDSGNNNSFGQQPSYEHDSSDTSAGKYEVYRIETLPDPTAARKGRNGALPQSSLAGSGLGGSGLAGSGLVGSPSIIEQSSTDSEAQVLPTAVRQTKKRRGQSPSVGSGRQNLSYSPNMIPETSAPQHHQPKPRTSQDDRPQQRTMQSYTSDGYDMYTGKEDNTGGFKPPKKDPVADAEAKERRRQQRRQKQQAQVAQSGQEPPQTYQPPAGYLGSGFQNEAFQPQEADLGYPVQQQSHSRQTQQAPPTRRPQQHNTSHNLSSSYDENLHITVKAQPGTAIHITPTGTRAYHAPRTVKSPSQSSVETEI